MLDCDINCRINELTVVNERLKQQIGDKDRSIATLQRQLATVETRNGSIAEDDVIATEVSNGLNAAPSLKHMSPDERQEIVSMHEALRRIAEEVGPEG